MVVVCQQAVRRFRLTIAGGGTLLVGLGLLSHSWCVSLHAAKPENMKETISPLAAPAQAYLDFAFQACDRVETNLINISRVAEIVAKRHVSGGTIEILANGQSLGPELQGRSGGMIGMGGKPFTNNRSDAEKTNAVALIGWETPPATSDNKIVQDARRRNCYLIGFGPRTMRELSPLILHCDVWFDTGFGDTDRVVHMTDGTSVGRGNLLLNTLHAWALTAEIVAALTREGKMPTMYKSIFCPDGRDWNSRYVGRQLFHEDLQITAVPRGMLAREYLNRIRGYLRQFQKNQMRAVEQTAQHIASELEQGKKTVVAMLGHMPRMYVGKAEDAAWASPLDFYGGSASQVKTYSESTSDGALVLRLGYSAQLQTETEIFTKKQQRVMLVVAEDTPRTDSYVPTNLLTCIEMGWEFGDACVAVPGYPIKILPPSGIMQLVVYECISGEVQKRYSLGKRKNLP